MVTTLLQRELKRGSTEVLILALLEERERHGYDIGRLIDERSGGAITFHTASLYPTLYRLEDKGLVDGRWVERAGQRRRRCYRLTPAGRKVLSQQRSTWEAFFHALDRVARIKGHPEDRYDGIVPVDSARETAATSRLSPRADAGAAACRVVRQAGG